MLLSPPKAESAGRFSCAKLHEHARARRVPLPTVLNTPYRNSVSLAEQPQYPGNLEVEQRLGALVRWNALAFLGGQAERTEPFSELRRDAMTAEREHHLRGDAARSWIASCLENSIGPIVAASDYVRVVLRAHHGRRALRAR